MSDQLFEQATRKKLRFQHCGNLSVEDLWDLPLQTLDAMFMSLNAELKSQNESESLLQPRLAEHDDTEIKVELLRHIVEVKLGEAAAAQEEQKRRERKQRIMQVIAKKEDEGLEAMSTEDLGKMLAEL